MKRLSRTTASLLPMMLAMLSGCASTSSVEVHYTSDTQHGTHLLLAARTPEERYRAEWESACAPILARAGYQVTQSHRVMPGWYEPGNTALKQRAQDLQLQNILVAELTALLVAQFPEMHETRLNPEAGSGIAGVHEQITPIRDYRAMRDVPPSDQNVEATLLTTDGHPLWRGDITTREANSIKAIARSQCRALVKAL
ncbi:hypothetical protein [Isoalcanivorax indicus]|uniref:hypothetical protein n=1 Tax=Isoalcanivorax indicus TaxID=2202653 RepID=UPI0013C4B29C|nr:hypothetical protein [Isoalcanivorax indicus]